MFDHSKSSLFEACGVSKERIRELQKLVGICYMEADSSQSEVIEEILKKTKDCEPLEVLISGILYHDLREKLAGGNSSSSHVIGIAAPDGVDEGALDELKAKIHETIKEHLESRGPEENEEESVEFTQEDRERIKKIEEDMRREGESK